MTTKQSHRCIPVRRDMNHNADTAETPCKSWRWWKNKEVNACNLGNFLIMSGTDREVTGGVTAGGVMVHGGGAVSGA